MSARSLCSNFSGKSCNRLRRSHRTARQATNGSNRSRSRLCCKRTQKFTHTHTHAHMRPNSAIILFLITARTHQNKHKKMSTFHKVSASGKVVEYECWRDRAPAGNILLNDDVRAAKVMRLQWDGTADGPLCGRLSRRKPVTWRWRTMRICAWFTYLIRSLRVMSRTDRIMSLSDLKAT